MKPMKIRQAKCHGGFLMKLKRNKSPGYAGENRELIVIKKKTSIC